MSPKYPFIDEALRERRSTNQLRSLRNIERIPGTMKVATDHGQLINFCSNDYLGLSQHPKVKEKAAEFTQKYGASSSSSRLIAGSISIHRELEERLADFLETESGLLFNTGYQANTSLIAALADRNSCIIADKKIHNSLIQGAILSRSKLQRFRHLDFEHLRELLEKESQSNHNRIWLVTETLFSMDGDLSDMDRITRLAKQHNALLYSDDAHAIGLWGEEGKGLNKDFSADLSVITFGKAFGGFGAFAGCSNEMRDYLINFSSGFIYSTALPPSVIGGLNAALDLMPELEGERRIIRDHIEYLMSGLKEIGLDTPSNSTQIIPVMVGSEERAISLSTYLEENGLLVAAIRPPTVPENASRLRITLSSLHSREEIDQLLYYLKKWIDANG